MATLLLVFCYIEGYHFARRPLYGLFGRLPTAASIFQNNHVVESWPCHRSVGCPLHLLPDHAKYLFSNLIPEHKAEQLLDQHLRFNLCLLHSRLCSFALLSDLQSRTRTQAFAQTMLSRSQSRNDQQLSTFTLGSIHHYPIPASAVRRCSTASRSPAQTFFAFFCPNTEGVAHRAPSRCGWRFSSCLRKCAVQT